MGLAACRSVVKLMVIKIRFYQGSTMPIASLSGLKSSPRGRRWHRNIVLYVESETYIRHCISWQEVGLYVQQREVFIYMTLSGHVNFGKFKLFV